MVKKSCLCISISSFVCVSMIICCVVLVVLGENQATFYDKKYIETTMRVINYIVKYERCIDTVLNSYTGYVIFEYVVPYNMSSKIPFFANISGICGSTYSDVLVKAKDQYQMGEMLRIWYYIDDPTVWILYKPRGEMYLVGVLLSCIIFIISLMICMIFVCKRSKKRIIY